MRKLVLIAAMVMASASAYAGDSRSLSTSMTTEMPSGQPAAPVQPQADNSLRAYPDTASAETPRYRLPPSDASQQSTPHGYAQRPAVVDNTPQTAQPPQAIQPPQTTESTPPAATPSTNVDRAEQTTTHRAPTAHAHADRSHRYGGRWTAGRIIAELHRYGVYW
jgi:hypothetical protein